VKILAIETSCDETAAAVIADGRHVRSNVVWSQVSLHRPYGGVVPELAARAHVEAIRPVVSEALSTAQVDWTEIDAIAVTNRPGLSGALLVGVNVAKAIGFTRRLPIVPVHHIEGHIAAAWLIDADQDFGEIRLPATCLVVSGGHTELIQIERAGDYRLLGATLDDAAGEAFDKGARLLGLGYPGGPAIQNAAATGDPSAHPFPRAWLDDSFDFSFSGLKTALSRATRPYHLDRDGAPRSAVSAGGFAEHVPARFRSDMPVADLAAGYQEAIVDVLAEKTLRAARAFGSRSVLLVGGVAANRALRERLATRIGEVRSEVDYIVPAFGYCTDNAAMIGVAGFWTLQRGDIGGFDLDVISRQLLAERIA